MTAKCYSFKDKQRANLLSEINNCELIDEMVQNIAYGIWFNSVNAINMTGMLLPQPDKKSSTYDEQIKFYNDVNKAFTMYQGTWKDLPNEYKDYFIGQAKNIVFTAIGLSDVVSA